MLRLPPPPSPQAATSVENPGAQCSPPNDEDGGIVVVVETQAASLMPIDLRWSHATNTRALIDHTLAGDGVDFIEADVCYDDRVGPYMAHGEADLDTIDDRRQNAIGAWLQYLDARRPNRQRPGLKLDFKMEAAVIPSLAQLHEAEACYPIWLNADILPGPRGVAPVFDADAFIEAGLRLPNATLSLGWTTGDARRDLDPVGYSTAMIDAMLAVCRPLLLDRDVTFPVRAIDALHSPDQLQRLLSHGRRWSLTIWNGREGVRPDEERQLHAIFDPNRTYLDLVPCD